MIKPGNIKEKFRHLKLNNGLELFLIQSENKLQGARLRINAGSNQETFDKFQGLAHLLEHVLYNGDPSSEFKLSDLIAQNNGQLNANTNDKSTDYYFTIQNNFKQAISLWSKAFKNVQFSEKDIEREIKAVNSEFLNAQSEDQWIYQEQLRQMGNSQNPFSRFSIGSFETLPLNNKQEILQEAIKFYQKYYKAKNMYLMLVGKEDLDNLQQIAQEYFGSIEEGEKNNNEFAYDAFDLSQMGKFIYLQSKNQINTLTLVFPIKKTLLNYYEAQHPNHQAFFFINKLIQDDSNFINNLHKKNYLINFENPQFWQEPADSDLFQIKFTLTDQGFENSNYIIKDFFAYINALINILDESKLKKYHNQFSLLSYIEFFYQENFQTMDYIEHFQNWVIILLILQLFLQQLLLKSKLNQFDIQQISNQLNKVSIKKNELFKQQYLYY